MDFNIHLNTPIPAAYQKILPRTRIYQLIDNALRNEVICLTAPYGCGKTFAVMSWLRQSGKQARWINLSEKDNSESELVAELTAAILKSDKKELRANSQYLQNPGAFLYDAAYKAAAEHGQILVIDNFQFVKDREPLRFVKNFVSSFLGQWRIIIISRAELPPVFNDLILKGHIKLITPSELNLNLRETADYFAMNGHNVAENDIVKIHSETEGWTAALNAVLTASREGLTGYNETARSYIMTFFETEVWCGLSEDIKNFLIKTSLPDILTPSSCYAVTDLSAALPVLKWLWGNGLFISKLEKPNTYGYYRVFRDFLSTRLEASNVDKSHLYTKVAWYFFEKGEEAQSFPYFFKAGDYYGMSAVLKMLNPAEMGIESYLEMAYCITALKVEDLKSYPMLVARMALIHYLVGNIEEMQRLSAVVHEWLDSGSLMITPEEYGEFLWEVGWLVYIDPAEAVLNNLKHVEWSNYEEYVPRVKPTHFQRFGVLRLPSAISGIRDYCPSVASIDAFIKYNEKSNIIRGEYALYEMDLISAEYAYETENFEKAEELTHKIMALSESKLYIDLYFLCTVLLVKIMRAMNNTREIATLTARLESMIANSSYHFLFPNFHAFELRNKLLDGHRGFTEIFMRENEKYRDSSFYYLIYRRITYVRGLLSLGNYGEAMLILNSLELTCIKYSRTKDLAEVNILKAAASYHAGHKEKARAFFLKAFKGVEEYGFIRIFSDDAANIWNILESVKKHVNGKYMQNIIISCKKSLSGTGYKLFEKKYSHTELTKTELKILKSLQSGMSYTEIAVDNNIRMSTVKSHVHSIYSKLEVNNKTSAIITAKNLRIIE